MISGILKKLFGSKSERDIKRMRPLVQKINQLEVEYQKLSDEELKAKTAEFKKRYTDGESLDNLLPEAFATVKNACRRLTDNKARVVVCDHELEWDMIPYDVQIMGGVTLHRGNIAEMATGEGKTLVATFPLYLNALTGKNCQLVTVNDYLARRDCEWMGAVYNFLDLTVGCIQNSMDSAERKEAYNCDITYGTNSEFGFDYLRDMGMANDKDRLVQRDHYYVIIDEVDSILIDEARTPLIIAGPVAVSTHKFHELSAPVADLFRKQSQLCSELLSKAKSVLTNENATKEELDDAYLKLFQVKLGMPSNKQLMHILEDGSILKQLEKKESFVRSDMNKGMIQEVQSDLFFVIDEKRHEADLTEKGHTAISPNDPNAFIVEDMLEVIHSIDNDESLDELTKAQKKEDFQRAFSDKSEKIHNISQLLRAYCLFEKDFHYVVADNKVVIVDEHTGRPMPGRRFSDGLHQALEAKENVKIEKETQTLATITIQNYFRMYEKLAGMTGTAETEATELHQIYKLDVTVIPTNRPCQRIDLNDSIYKTRREKFNAVVNTVKELHAKGQPVLVGTISVDDSEIISRMLKSSNIPHNVLNAKNHQHEADIVANAGQKGAVTVATNMAGRGTDIKLGPEVRELGGLYVIGSARHDSRRIDRQLRGRCSRQGDPGCSRFFVSLEDNLMRLFGSDRIVKIMERFGMEEGEDLQHPWLNRSIETAQRRVEQHHFAMRKRTLEYDDVMNKQREIIYGIRKDALLSETPENFIFSIVDEEVNKLIELIAASQIEGEEIFDFEKLAAKLLTMFPISFTVEELKETQEENAKSLNFESLANIIIDKITNEFTSRQDSQDNEQADWLCRYIILESIDNLWQEHLHHMDHLRSSINLRQYAQKDPLIEYRHEAFALFQTLMDKVHHAVIENMFRMSFDAGVDFGHAPNTEELDLENMLQQLQMQGADISMEQLREFLSNEDLAIDDALHPELEMQPMYDDQFDYVQIPFRHGAKRD
ncbi:preprotein translocase subunit SecA [Lentisphaerota bacterium WC36G]|nr:preprotein translocase subunit SecA [Lentisphaerae bacterium WC36]